MLCKMIKSPSFRETRWADVTAQRRLPHRVRDSQEQHRGTERVSDVFGGAPWFFFFPVCFIFFCIYFPQFFLYREVYWWQKYRVSKNVINVVKNKKHTGTRV